MLYTYKEKVKERINDEIQFNLSQLRNCPLNCVSTHRVKINTLEEAISFIEEIAEQMEIKEGDFEEYGSNE